jgi:diguanylate cyclase (GGDEF)-like protein
MIAAGCLTLGGTLIIGSLDAYQRARISTQELARFNLALSAVNAVSAERGPANSAMGASDEQMPARAAALAAKRRLTDQSLDGLQASFHSELSRPGEAESLARRLRLTLAAGRDAVDRVVSLPIDQRSGALVRDAIERMFAAADVSAALRDDLGHGIAKSYPRISAEIILSTAGSSMREHAGRLGSYVVMMLSSASDANRDLQDKLASAEGRITELRALARAYVPSVSGGDSIAKVLVDVDDQYFHRALPFAREVARRVGSADGQMTLAEFTDRYVPGMTSLGILREQVIAASQQSVASARDRARNILVSAIVLTMLVSTMLILAVVTARKLLFGPLIRARDEITAIARGALDEPRRAWPQAGLEMREVFDELAVLREQQRRKRVLEQTQDRMAVRLKRLSETDGLTGLLNRRALEVLGWKAFAGAEQDRKPLAVIMFDIDHFKSVNDTHGHHAGDVVLKHVADLIQARLRPGDRLARFGGEEFVILVPDDDENRVRLIAERLRSAIARTPIATGIAITASFGIAVRQRDDASWGDLIARADQCLYAAKRMGRNRVCARPEELRRSA